MRKITTLLLVAVLVCITGCSSSAGKNPSNDTANKTADNGKTDTSDVSEIPETTKSADDSESAEDEPVTLRLALRSDIYTDVIAECLSEFEEEYNVECIIDSFSESDLYYAITLDAENNDGYYDFCMVDGSWMAEFTEKELLADLNDWGYSLDDDIIPATTSICYVDDHLYVAPYFGNVTVLMYNKQNVLDAGFDTAHSFTMNEIIEICEKAQAKGKLGFVFRGDSENNLVVDFLPILLSHGGWVVDEENNPALNTTEVRDAMHYYLRLISTGQAMSKSDIISGLDSGDVTMAVGWPGWYMPNESTPVDFSAFSGMVSADSFAYNANVYGIWTIGVPQTSQKKELAVKLLEHLMDRDVQKSTIPGGGVPCRFSSLRDPEVLKSNPQFSVVCDALESGVYRPTISEWTDFYTILGDSMSQIIEGDKSVDEGLSDAHIKIQGILK